MVAAMTAAAAPPSRAALLIFLIVRGFFSLFCLPSVRLALGQLNSPSASCHGNGHERRRR